MTEAYLAYFTILFTLVVFSSFICISKTRIGKFLWGYLIPILIVAIILGGRYKTGTDWPNYKDYYDSVLKGSLTIGDAFATSLEPVYTLLMAIVAFFKKGSSYFFALIAIIQFSSIYYLYKDQRKYLSLALFFYTIFNLTLDVNVARQSLAMSMIFISYKYVCDNKYLCVLFFSIAVGFHYSALFAVFLLFIDKPVFRFLDKSFWVVLLYIVTLIFSAFLSDYILNYSQIVDFGNRFDRNVSYMTDQMKVSSGYGLLVTHFLNILLIYLWSIIKTPEKDYFHTYAYRLCVIGFLCTNIFGISVSLSRLAIYYSHFSFVLWTFIVYHIIHSKRNLSLIACGVLLLDLLFFVFSIYNSNGGCSPYMFKWIY